MEFISTVTGIAEKYLGDVEQYRKVYADNPKLVSYRLPPSAQKSIDLLAQQGIKLPNVTEINKQLEGADKEVNKALGGLFRDVNAKVEKSGVETAIKDGSKLLKSLDWLL